MSSPATAGSQPMAKTISQKTLPRPGGPSTPGASTNNISTPRSQQTPASQYFSPSASRLSGKHPSKTPAMSTPTPSSGAHALAGIESPALMGMDPGSTGTNLRMSGLGLSMGVSTTAKLDDAERKRRLEAVLATLGIRPGPISQTGVERLARRWGLELYQEPGEKNLVTLGGGNYAVDLIFDSNESSVVDRVALHFFGLNDTVMEHADAAAEVLHRDLTPPRENILAPRLDRFADNLERLSRLDKLSVAGASCFEAVYGVYTSLKRLYDNEKRAAEALLALKGQQAHLHVLCKNGGRPRTHARRRVGVGLDYWINLHRNPTRRDRASCNDVMTGVEGSMSEEMTKVPEQAMKDEDTEQVYFLTLECEHCPPALYPPIRVTSDWLTSKEVSDTLPERNDEKGEEGLSRPRQRSRTETEWLEPSPILAAGTEGTDLMNGVDLSMQPASQQPQTRFVARPEPSIFLPVLAATEVYAAVGINISQDPLPPLSDTFDSFVLKGILHTEKHLSANPYFSTLHDLPEPREALRTRTINTYNITGQSYDVETQSQKADWGTQLYIPHPELARKITSLPFSHPRQIIALLPRLRQYTLLARILQNSFAFADRKTGNDSNGPANSATAKRAREGDSTDAPIPAPRRIRRVAQPQAAMAQLLSGKSTSTPNPDLPSGGPERAGRSLDVSLSQLYPIARFIVIIDARSATRQPGVYQPQQGAGKMTLRVDILENGDVKVEDLDGGDDDSEDIDMNGLETHMDEGMERTPRRKRKRLSDVHLAEGLATCEDIVVWAEWILSRSGG